MSIVYNSGQEKYSNWIIKEDRFEKENQAKFETIFSLGNGYMGIRGSLEETYPNKQPGFYIAGLFDKYPGEVVEMPNLPDWLKTEIFIGNERFDLKDGKIHQYQRNLNLKEGLLKRKVIWENKKGDLVQFNFERFISLSNLHTGAQKIEIKALNFSGKVQVVSGIDGRVSNSGTQHLKEGTKRIIKNNIIYKPKTQKANIRLCMGLGHKILTTEENLKIKESFKTERRRINKVYEFNLNKDQKVTMMKLISIYTDNDKSIKKGESLEDITFNHLVENLDKGYQTLKNNHIKRWNLIWDKIDIIISGNNFDQLAVRFALFHLIQMTPAHDDRISIAAKGLSGEGYKGHVFWDTEIFILPFFIYNFPKTARSLLKYRYNTLKGALKKASDKGYQGAMFAWESAETGKETTPQTWGIDILTGKEIEVLGGDLQQHITADIQYAFNQYYKATDDFKFMKEYGFEVFFQATKFWSSRVEYNEKTDRYEINDVMGPDEYKEHVDNNAFTNYMVKWQFNKALKYVKMLKKDYKSYFKKLKEKINISEQEIKSWREKEENIFLPSAKKNNIIAQYQGFENLKEIDLKEYKITQVGKIFDDYGWEEIKSAKVIKQPDVLMLIYLLKDKFDSKTIEANFNYYESLTLHDSSLSPAVHAVLAANVGNIDKSYDLFKRACKIDLNSRMNSSDEGLHAASLGGLWQAVIFGFAGVELKEEKIKLSPHLPKQWQALTFKLRYRNSKYEITIDQENIKIEVLENINNSLYFEIEGTKHKIKKTMHLKY